MKLSSERILTTHVGSLPRPKNVTELIFAKEREEDYVHSEFDEAIASAVRDAVARQADAGIDIVSDGEMSKISYATYISERISGFEGDAPRSPPKDLQDYPSFLEKLAISGGTPTYKRPKCTGEIRPVNSEPLQTDLKNFHAALEDAGVEEAFMNTASPGVIALFQPNEYYASHEEYIEALAEAMRVEYEGIVAAGFLLQLDSPDLGLGRQTLFADKTDEEYQRLAGIHVDVLNHALRNIPADRVRLHVCWGN